MYNLHGISELVKSGYYNSEGVHTISLFCTFYYVGNINSRLINAFSPINLHTISHKDKVKTYFLEMS